MSYEETPLRDYKIPRRRGENSDYSGYANTVVAGSYYNYYASQGQWQQGASYTQYPTLYPPTQYPTMRYNPSNPIDPVTQNICNALSSTKEKPKVFRKNIFKETVPDIEDNSLPKELTLMFQPLYCKLCSAQLSSNIMAKLHYKSKNHEKKIRKFLVEHAEATGEPLHKRARMSGTPKSEDEKNPRWFHCEICDLPLTGKMHAESHYMGRNHQKAIMGHKPPSGQGYFNPDGQWVRKAKAKKVILKDGEDTFGLDFRPQTDSSEPQAAVPAAVPAPSTSTSSSSQGGRYQCDVCNVGATCQEQIDMHFRGQKHQKKLRQLGLPQINSAGAPTATLPEPVIENINLSVYVTPSGGFYCPSCNLSMNSELQFMAHMKSKGHFKKSTQKSS